MIRILAVTILAMSISLGAIRQDATPTPDDKSSKFAFATPAATVGCEGLEAYATQLLALDKEHSLFLNAAYNKNDYYMQTLSDQDAQAVADDGQALLDGLNVLAVPESYAKGQQGIVMLQQFNLDAVIFLGIDASKSINYDAATQAFALILEGETATAKACPKEVKAIGGYVYIDIDTLNGILNK